MGMANDRTPDSLDYIRYEVSKFHFVFPGGGVTEIVPEAIQSLMIDNKYHENFLPLVSVKVRVDIKTYFQLLANRGKFRVNFEVRYWKDIPGKPTYKRVLFNKRFTTLLNDNTPNLLKQNIDKADETIQGDSNDEHTVGENKYLTVTMYLFEERNLNALYSVTNALLDNANMTSVLLYLLGGAGVDRLLIAPLDNTRSYSDVILPPATMVSTFKYLESHYGFYKDGAMLYLGLIHSFVLPKRPGLEAWYTDEMRRTIFMVKESDNQRNFESGSGSDFDAFTGYINIRPTDMTIQSSEAVDYLIGNDVKGIDTRTGSSTSSSVKSTVGKQTKVLHNKYSNPYQTSMYANQVNNSRDNVFFKLKYINIKWLEPNKDFIINFEDKRIDAVYGGKYQLVVSQIVFRNKGDHMHADAVVQLSR